MSVERLDDLLLKWEELFELGYRATPEELCRDCPELLDSLRKRIDALRALNPALDTGSYRITDDLQVGKDTAPKLGTSPPQAVAVPGYSILGELGRGGMGVVYKALHLSLNRLVALKMILMGAHAGTQQRLRFRAEAEAAARLQHPNMVQVYEVSEQDGCPYIALELVEGCSLCGLIAEGLPPPEKAAALVEQLAGAVDYAHRRGIVHRDLKPGNVLIATDGTPKITDFGLAKRLDENSSNTRTGDILGTPCYMAPEQAAGKTREVGPPADIYALGAILYELLTGLPPFEGLSSWETVNLVLTTEPEPPSKRNPRVPRDLETICLKCLQKEPAKRYSTGLALADDLRRFQNGEPIHARPVGSLERGIKWVKRHKALASLLATSAILLLALTIGGWVAQANAFRTNKELKELNRVNHRALIQLNVSNGVHYLDDEDLFGSLIWFTRALTLEDQDDRGRSHRVRIASVLRDCPRLGQLWFHDDAVVAVAFSPDGKWMLTASEDHTAHVWDAVTGTPRFETPLRHEAGIHRASFSPDGTRIVTASADNTACVWDAATGRRIASMVGHQGEVRDARFSPDGKSIVTASADGTARIWEAATGALIGEPLLHGGEVIRASFHPDGDHILTASADGAARIWRLDVEKAEVMARLKHDGPVTDAVFSPDGKQVATASEDRTARIWEAATGKPITEPLRHRGAVLQVAFRPDGQRLATASADLTARVWDAKTGQALAPVLRHYSAVGTVAFSPDGTKVLTGSDDNSARVWDAETGRAITPPLRHNGEVAAVCFSPDGQRIATASEDTTARIYELETRTAPTLLHHTASVLRASYSPDGTRVLTACADQTARVWDGNNGKELAILSGHTGEILAAEFSRDGRRIVTASKDATARVWDGKSYQLLATLSGHIGPVRKAVFSANGDRVATTSDDRTARVWDAASGQLITELKQDKDGILDAVFSPDGSRVATGDSGGNARLWDAASGKSVGQPMRHQRGVVRVAFSPDGRRLATASLDRTARLWDVASGQPFPNTPLEHAGPVRDVSFSPDGSRVLTYSDDNTAQVWSAETGSPLLPPLRHYGSVTAARFSTDGTRVATASADNTSRVWDAATGEPLTPPIVHPGGGQISDIAFSPSGEAVVTAGADGAAQIYWLASTDWSPEDLERLAGLLSGSRIARDGGSLVALDVKAIRRLWDELRSRRSGSVGPVR